MLSCPPADALATPAARGTMTVTGPGTLALAGYDQNTYGATVVQNGTLVLNNGAWTALPSTLTIGLSGGADTATVRAIVILGALLYQFVNLLTDLCYAWLDPRVRLE